MLIDPYKVQICVQYERRQGEKKKKKSLRWF
jgi:hypothetical protein